MFAMFPSFINHRIAVITIFVILLNSAMPIPATTAFALDVDPGSLDPTFDGDGLVSTTVGLEGYDDTRGQAVVMQPDGKVIVAGEASRSSYGSNTIDFALVRYNSDGSLDTSFDTDGTTTTDFGNYDDEAQAIALQPDGKIVVAGYRIQNDDWAENECVLARYNGDGSLDTSFDGDGKVTINVGNDYEILNAIAIQPDGKIIVVGTKTTSINDDDIIVIRFNSDGSLDTTFDTDGIVITAIGSKNEHGSSITVQPDGKIIVGGTTNNGLDSDFALVRYHSDGSLDTSFSTDGIATLDYGDDRRGHMALQPDGKILIAGYSFDVVLLARYNSDGTLDTSFDIDGLVTDADARGLYIQGIALDGNGKIMLAGYASFHGSTGFDFALARYNPDGSLDTGFGTDGKVFTDFGSNYSNNAELAFSVAVQSDGKIVAAGYRYVEDGIYYQIAVARYIGGELDPTVPGIATLRTPSGDIGANYLPAYTWDEVPGAESYYLWVDGPSGSGLIKQWYTAVEANCNGTTCSVTPTTILGGGNHAWAIQARNSVGDGPWSSPKTFSTTMPTVPAAATPRTPSGDIGANYNPIYTWDEVPGATSYYLWVDAPSASGLIKQWLTPAQANCNGTTCSVTPMTTLGGGNHTWAIQTWNSVGYGPWSSPKTFNTTPPVIPGAATLRTPSGNIGTLYNPTYTWDEVPGTAAYYLWVDGPSTQGVIKQWFTPAQANCNGTTCSVTPTTTLGGGSHIWSVQTWNKAGYGPWSSAKSFSLTPPTIPAATVARTPSGNISDTTPTYTWDEVPGTAAYYLWVDSPSTQGVIKQWFTPAQANCNGTTCSVTPTTILGGGSHTWAVQTWNKAGYGPWSNPVSFTITP